MSTRWAGSILRPWRFERPVRMMSPNSLGALGTLPLHSGDTRPLAGATGERGARILETFRRGGMAEWSMAVVLKTLLEKLA
jgi:hypothetical protein